MPEPISITYRPKEPNPIDFGYSIFPIANQRNSLASMVRNPGERPVAKSALSNQGRGYLLFQDLQRELDLRNPVINQTFGLGYRNTADNNVRRRNARDLAYRNPLNYIYNRSPRVKGRMPPANDPNPANQLTNPIGQRDPLGNNDPTTQLDKPLDSPLKATFNPLLIVGIVLAAIYAFKSGG